MVYDLILWDFATETFLISWFDIHRYLSASHTLCIFFAALFRCVIVNIDNKPTTTEIHCNLTGAMKYFTTPNSSGKCYEKRFLFLRGKGYKSLYSSLFSCWFRICKISGGRNAIFGATVLIICTVARSRAVHPPCGPVCALSLVPANPAAATRLQQKRWKYIGKL